MEAPLNLVEIFLAHASVHVAVPDGTIQFECLLLSTWEKGRAAWPRVPLSAGVFVRHLAERLPRGSEGSPLELTLEKLELADLYLACACIREVPGAIEALEEHYLMRLSTALAHFKPHAPVIDEVCQQVRIHLLLGTSGFGPRLARYNGEGKLSNWIVVIAKRMFLKQFPPAREMPEQDMLTALNALPTPGPDPEFDLIQRRYSREFRLAVREAFATLSSEQRHLLRLHFIHRLSTTEMGKAFGVNQSTISRRLKSVRETVYEETKRVFQQRLGLSSQEFASLLVAIKSQLDLSLSRLLKEEPD